MEERDALPRFAAFPVAAVTVLCVALLAATSGQYGYHRDELYFRISAGISPGAMWTNRH